MSLVIRFTIARRQTVASLRATWLSGGTLETYTSPVPASADVAISTQTKLCTYALPNPIGEVASGIIAGDDIDEAMCIASGTPAFCRAKDSSGVVIGDFLVGLTNTGYAVEFDNLTFISGSYVPLSSFSITEG